MLALLTPVLPVKQDRATLDWPQAGTSSVEAPLVSYVPLRMHATLPCALVRAVGPAGTVVSTVPVTSGQAATKGLVVSVADGVLSAILRDVPLLSAPVEEITAGTGCTALTIDSTAAATSTELTGVTRQDGTPFRNTVTRDIRPQIVGVFTDLAADRLDGAAVHADIDSRFSSSPTALKLAAIVVAALSTVVALLALHLLDTSDGGRGPGGGAPPRGGGGGARPGGGGARGGGGV